MAIMKFCIFLNKIFSRNVIFFKMINNNYELEEMKDVFRQNTKKKRISIYFRIEIYKSFKRNLKILKYKQFTIKDFKFCLNHSV